MMMGNGHKLLSLLILILLGCAISPAPFAQDDAQGKEIVTLGNVPRAIVQLYEAVRWPAFDYKDAKGFLAEANTSQTLDFFYKITKILNPDYVPKDPVHQIRLLKGWRGRDRNTWMAQYEKGPYCIRIKDQVTSITGKSGRSSISNYIALIIQRIDGKSSLEPGNQKNILEFTDRLLTKEVGSSAQDYRTNIDKINSPIYQHLGDGYSVMYQIAPMYPPICGVSIWTNGIDIVINFQLVPPQAGYYPTGQTSLSNPIKSIVLTKSELNLLSSTQAGRKGLIEALNDNQTLGIAYGILFDAARSGMFKGDQENIDRLVALLNSEEFYIREKIAYILGWMGEPSTFDAILNAYQKEKNSDVKMRLSDALGKNKVKKALSILETTANTDPDQNIRERARIAICRIQGIDYGQWKRDNPDKH